MTENQTTIEANVPEREIIRDERAVKLSFEKVLQGLIACTVFVLKIKYLASSLRFAAFIGTETAIHKCLHDYVIYFGGSANILYVMNLAFEVTIFILTFNTLTELFEESIEKLLDCFYGVKISLKEKQKLE